MALAPGAPAGATDELFNYRGTLPGVSPGAVYPSNLPNAAGLESLSSRDIEGLLNPPALFPDTSRRAAEVSAGRGIAGSAAAYGTDLRMTDEERIRRIALGEQLLGGAYQRTLPYNITPYQGRQLSLEDQRLQLERDRLNAMIAAGYFERGGRGGGGGGGGGRVGGGGTDFGTSVSRGLTDFPWTDLTRSGGGPSGLGPDLSGVLLGGGSLAGAQTGGYYGNLDFTDYAGPGMDVAGPGIDVAGPGMDFGGDMGGSMSAQDYLDLIGGDFTGGGGGDEAPTTPEEWYYFTGGE